jgi:hypothetical protein
MMKEKMQKEEDLRELMVICFIVIWGTYYDENDYDDNDDDDKMMMMKLMFVSTAVSIWWEIKFVTLYNWVNQSCWRRRCKRKKTYVNWWWSVSLWYEMG